MDLVSATLLLVAFTAQAVALVVTIGERHDPGLTRAAGRLGGR